VSGFTAEDLIACYQRGVFPMSDDRNDQTLFLVDPPTRGILPLDAIHVPGRLARKIRSNPFEIRIDTAFEQIIRLCAGSSPSRQTTWISHGIEALYVELFHRGVAHSVECWDGLELVGGLYGVSLGGVFFGESMASQRTDSSKIALVHLCARLIAGGYALLDAQFHNQHLEQFGILEIPRMEFHRRLGAALNSQADFYEWTAGDGAAALQLISQAS
jgi:leucyl/phenylalanyl-tRNA--protein transferase